MHERADPSAVSETGGHDVAVLGTCGWRHEHVILVQDAAPEQGFAGDAEVEDVVAGQEAAVHRDVARAIVRRERRLGRDHPREERHGLRAGLPGVPDDAHAARSRLVALDEALLRQRAEEIADRFCRLYAKLLRDFANAWLVGVLSQEIDEVVIDPALTTSSISSLRTPTSQPL